MLIEYLLSIDRSLSSDNKLPSYPVLNKAGVLYILKPLKIVRYLEDLVQTLYKISEEVSQDLLKSNITEKNKAILYRKIAERLYKIVQQLQDIRARKLGKIL